MNEEGMWIKRMNKNDVSGISGYYFAFLSALLQTILKPIAM